LLKPEDVSELSSVWRYDN